MASAADWVGCCCVASRGDGGASIEALCALNDDGLAEVASGTTATLITVPE